MSANTTLPNGTYSVSVPNNNAISGTLVVSGQPGSQTATYQWGQNSEVDVTNLDVNSPNIGWIVPLNDVPLMTFSGGIYNPPGTGPATITGGTVGQVSWTAAGTSLANGSYTVDVPNETAISGTLVVSGQPGSQSAKYHLEGTPPPPPITVTSLFVYSPNIGWNVTISGTSYPFSGGTYNPPGPGRATITGGLVAVPSLDNDMDPWTAEATTPMEEKYVARAGA